MNLIEQLGGYSAAKEVLYLQNKEWVLTPKQTRGVFGFEFTSESLANALLEHRRANNIFEMDDYIIHDGELKVFAMWSTAIEGCAYIGYAYAEDGEMADKSKFRHATDAEIAAGHRLPTCEVLDEADIPTTAIILEQKDGKQK